MRYPREQGPPAPMTKRARRRKEREFQGCPCAECLATVPGRAEAWRRQVAMVKRSIGKKEI